VVILVSVGSASRGDIQLFLLREARSGKVWFHAGGILHNETHIAATYQVLLRETGLPFVSDNLHIWFVMRWF
jgi:hypothetical protein